MMQPLFVLDSTSTANLQQQLIQKLIHAIHSGHFACGSKMPSSRKLAEQLGIARNTVVNAYEQLIDEGYLVSKERSGIYVRDDIYEQHAAEPEQATATSDSPQLEQKWQSRMNKLRLDKLAPPYPHNWQQYPYPFIDGQFDPSLFPVQQWRECSKLSLNVSEIRTWASDSGHDDDPLLAEEIRTKVLPRRGIYANPDEILVTLGSQHGLYLLSRLLLNNQTLVTTEEPGYPGIRQLAHQSYSPLHCAEVDENGICLDQIPAHTDVLYVTPSHQMPTAVTMPLEHREAIIAKANQDDFIVVEDDYASESNFMSQPHPAIKSLDSEGRVIYVSSFSKVLAPGLRLGFMVGPAPLIRQARQLRTLISRHPPANNQRVMGLFLSLGYYDQALRKLNQEMASRWQEMREALNHYLSTRIVTSRTVGGSTCWIEGPSQLNSQQFAVEAAKHGILIEPVERFYAGSEHPHHYFRLGVSSIPTEKIREGVELLAQIMREWEQQDSKNQPEISWGKLLKGKALRDFASRVEFIGQTVFGDPYRIRLYHDGSMAGWEGYQDERQDKGQWWLEGDRWFRQWRDWSYGETLGFDIYLYKNRINWVRDGKLVDSAFYRLHDPTEKTPSPASDDLAHKVT
ncbi:PLP-dependent aminotransferase family protein [Pseudidiomarina terrestris]|uniref:MocR-like pyridoxine biosynthesis transcription factor PdxR n=1 Tax=Pseudidiomarina terrestris TaxID=2820060 RepID=UPI00264CC478|nr:MULTISPECIES: PLP-dependent aminotransferase family protein [unclassified Pseudidiomarina]MDN7134598.1 PLP-dependent aminotransferase family protein [Pseudidiomarina sp. 1ASP75-5]MDN7136732.1 PLP-dependent aminotransferase family protein [Pseudidiomarina sp. 1ASP75-14]